MSKNQAKPIIVVSTGRTGTKFLAQLLGKLFDDRVSAFHETRYSALMNILTNAHMAHMMPKITIARTWNLLKQPQLKTCDKEYFFDANNHLYGLVVLLPELYPGLKVIHIVRDPREYVRSHINWSQSQKRSYFANNFVPFWRPNGFLIGEMSLKEWLRLSPFASFCKNWEIKNRHIQKLEVSEIPYLRTRFEDLFGAGSSTYELNRMLSFIGLPEIESVDDYFQKPVNTSNVISFPDWKDWSPEMCAQLDYFCGTAMIEYGYELESDWIKKVNFGYSQSQRAGTQRQVK